MCYHSKEKYWFLPKGRRNANEDTIRGAEREGFEESGYRNRVLPLPMKHGQPQDPDVGHQRFVTEPIWTQFMPLTSTRQYLLFWYVAETVPENVERACNDAIGGNARIYRAPEAFPADMTIKQRLAMDVNTGEDGQQKAYESVWHEGTGVDEDELLYRSFLLPIAEARRKLKGSVMEDVIRRGWDAVQARIEMEAT